MSDLWKWVRTITGSIFIILIIIAIVLQCNENSDYRGYCENVIGKSARPQFLSDMEPGWMQCCHDVYVDHMKEEVCVIVRRPGGGGSGNEED